MNYRPICIIKCKTLKSPEKSMDYLVFGERF